MNANKNLDALRKKMQQHQIDAWIIPSADPHLSEYLPDHWQARAWFSGFTGSVGTVVVTQNEAALWADSRYWEQAERQLSGSNIMLEKLGFGRTHLDWLAERLPENSKIGVAADMFSLADKQRLQQKLRIKNVQLIHTPDLLNEIWLDRPTLPRSKIFIHDVQWVSQNAIEKLQQVRTAMNEQGADFHLISALDDIAWLTNLRGSDIAFNPVFLAHLLIGKEQATLFVNAHNLDTDIQAALSAAQIDVQPYTHVANAFTQLSGSLLVEAEKTAVSTLQKLPENVTIIDSVLPSTLLKAQKSDLEIQHIRNAMCQDGAALCGFFAELEEQIAQKAHITECDIDTMLLKHRSQQPHFISASFDTIAGFNENGAMPHYHALPENCKTIEGDGLLLIDSGAQYQNGTTDITRVVPIGTPTTAQKYDFTLVLKAHIALATTIFPENILSPCLDAICRKPMWQAQCDYGHGTGHGVGYFLNVHEGPQRIAYQAIPQAHHAMKAGMVTSNEPGLYRPNQWGIRIENLVVNQKVENAKEQSFGHYLYFETLTLCPIDTRLIEPSMLSQEEKDWLNNYHQQVHDKLLPRVAGAAKDWLITRTKAI